MTYYMPEGKPVTPFNDGKHEYDRIIGMQNAENRTWRIIAIISAFALFVSIAIIFYAVNLPKTVPMVITVSDWGEAKYVGNISRYSYNDIKVPDIAIQYQIKRFLTGMGTITTDSMVMKQNINACYTMLTQSAASKLTDILRNNNPFEKFGSVKKNILIESMLQVSPQTYQVDYVENTTSISGALIQRIRYRALISTELAEPPDAQKIENPLGIYISAFDMTALNQEGELK